MLKDKPEQLYFSSL